MNSRQKKPPRLNDLALCDSVIHNSSRVLYLEDCLFEHALTGKSSFVDLQYPPIGDTILCQNAGWLFQFQVVSWLQARAGTYQRYPAGHRQPVAPHQSSGIVRQTISANCEERHETEGPMPNQLEKAKSLCWFTVLSEVLA